MKSRLSCVYKVTLLREGDFYMPLVSVVIPTYNRPEMLSEALASIRTQTFSDYEIIVVSNGENEESRKFSLAAATRYGAHFFAIEEGNVSAARNFGIKIAHGKWIAFLDDDDFSLPKRLELQLAAAERAGADMVVCENVEILPDGSERTPRNYYPDGWPPLKATCHQKWIALPSNTIITKAALMSVGSFDARQKANEDCDLVRRLLWRHKLHRMPDILTRRRIGHVSLSGNKRLIYVHELRHCLKMLFDTPADKRWALPALPVLVARPILKMITPRWLRQPRKTFARIKASPASTD